MSENESESQPISYKGQIGGYRHNAGRPPGITSKYSVASLLGTIQNVVGKSFSQSLAEGYLNSINDNDTKLRFAYEKIILDKVVADKVAVEVNDGATMESKMEAFAHALSGYSHKDTIPLNVTPTIEATVADNRSEDAHQDSDQADQDRARDDDDTRSNANRL